MLKGFTLIVIVVTLSITAGITNARRRKTVVKGPGPEFKSRSTVPTTPAGRKKPTNLGGTKDESETSGKRVRESSDGSITNPEWMPSRTPKEYYAGYAWRASDGVCLQAKDDVIETFTIAVSDSEDGPEKCLQKCWESLQLECWSVDYKAEIDPDDDTRLKVTCVLSKTSRVHNPTSTNVDVACCEGWTYFERVPGWIWRDKPNVTIRGTMLHKKSIFAKTLEACKKECAAEKDFLCMSVEWRDAAGPAKSKSGQKRSKLKAGPSEKNCHLQTRWKRYPTQTLSIEPGNIYAEKAVESATGWAWTSEQNACISNQGDTKTVSGVANMADCKDHCRNELEFVCRSVEYTDGTCRLLLVDSTDKPNFNLPCDTPNTLYSQKNL